MKAAARKCVKLHRERVPSQLLESRSSLSLSLSSKRYCRCWINCCCNLLHAPVACLLASLWRSCTMSKLIAVLFMEENAATFLLLPCSNYDAEHSDDTFRKLLKLPLQVEWYLSQAITFRRERESVEPQKKLCVRTLILHSNQPETFTAHNHWDYLSKTHGHILYSVETFTTGDTVQR